MNYTWDFEMGKINQVYTTQYNYFYERVIAVLLLFFIFKKAEQLWDL